MSTTTAPTVPTGPYWGFTLVELETEQANLKAQVQALNASLVGSSVNGQSFQFSDPAAQRRELIARQQDLQAAMFYLDPGRYPAIPPTNSSVAAFI